MGANAVNIDDVVELLIGAGSDIGQMSCSGYNTVRLGELNSHYY
jgi:hypothetical protein